MSSKNPIDPIKEINNTKYLNTVAIKSRYELMKVNKENLKNGYEIGTHWVKYTPYPVIDDDIRDNMAKFESYPIKKINTIKKGILDEISNSDIINQLNQNDQTKKLSNEIKAFQKKNCEMHEIEKKWVYIPKSIRLFKQHHPTDMLYTHSQNNLSKFYKRNKNIKISNPFETTTFPISKKPFSFTDKNFKFKYDKKVYDIKPLHIKNEKGHCYFPKVRSSSLESKNDKIEDNSNQKKSFDKNRNIVLLSILSPEEIIQNKTKYEKEIAKLNKSKNLFIGKDGDKKRVNLSVLAKGLKNNKELYKNINRNENFNKKNIFRRSIQIINLPAFNEKEEEKKFKKKKNRKYFDGKYLDDDIILNNEFPKRFYGLNYQFNENKKDIKITNDNIDLYQNEMNKKFVDIKQFVNKNFEKYLTPDINKEYDNKLLELKKNMEEKKKNEVKF